MLSLDPPSIDLITTFPADWRERVSRYQPSELLSPLVSRLKGVVDILGTASVAVEHVQALTRMACGLAEETMLAPYEHLFALIRRGAGGDWAIAEAFPEAKLDKKAPLDVAHRLIGCDGEWLILAAFIAAGWTPVRDPDRESGDWCVTRDGVTLGVEVKTKQSEGNSRGRLQFAFRGLAFLPEAVFLNACQWHWNRGMDLRQKWASRYFDLLREALPRIEQLLLEPPPTDRSEVMVRKNARLSVQRYGPGKLAFDLEPVTEDADERQQSAISLHAARGVKNGLLLPIQVGTRFLPMVTKSAAALSLHEVDLARLG